MAKTNRKIHKKIDNFEPKDSRNVPVWPEIRFCKGTHSVETFIRIKRHGFWFLVKFSKCYDLMDPMNFGYVISNMHIEAFRIEKSFIVNLDQPYFEGNAQKVVSAYIDRDQRDWDEVFKDRDNGK
jgi:hypothetical protein